MKKTKTNDQPTDAPSSRKPDSEATAAGSAEHTVGTDPTSASVDDSIPEEVEAEKAKARENWERLLRVTADFENFRKRAAREKEEAVRYANQKLLERLLPVLDSFDMAVAAAGNQNGETSRSLKEGIDLVFQQLKSVLAETGLEEIDAHGQPFDPNLHEAVSQVETEEVAEGHVAQQIRKGYLLRDRLVRPSSVIVAKKPAA